MAVASGNAAIHLADQPTLAEDDAGSAGCPRHLDVCVRGPCIRQGAPDCPLFLIVVRGKQRTNQSGRPYRRQPLPFLVNAVQDTDGHWKLPLPLDTLLF